jgi:hypothetical protein
MKKSMEKVIEVLPNGVNINNLLYTKPILDNIIAESVDMNYLVYTDIISLSIDNSVGYVRNLRFNEDESYIIGDCKFFKTTIDFLKISPNIYANGIGTVENNVVTSYELKYFNIGI